MRSRANPKGGVGGAVERESAERGAGATVVQSRLMMLLQGSGGSGVDAGMSHDQLLVIIAIVFGIAVLVGLVGWSESFREAQGISVRRCGP